MIATNTGTTSGTKKRKLGIIYKNHFDAVTEWNWYKHLHDLLALYVHHMRVNEWNNGFGESKGESKWDHGERTDTVVIY